MCVGRGNRVYLLGRLIKNERVVVKRLGWFKEQWRRLEEDHQRHKGHRCLLLSATF